MPIMHHISSVITVVFTLNLGVFTGVVLIYQPPTTKKCCVKVSLSSKLG